MTATTATTETTATDAPAVKWVTITAWKNMYDRELRYLGRQVVDSRVVATEEEFKEAWEEFGTHPETSYRAARPAADRWDTDKNLYY